MEDKDQEAVHISARIRQATELIEAAHTLKGSANRQRSKERRRDRSRDRSTKDSLCFLASVLAVGWKMEGRTGDLYRGGVGKTKTGVSFVVDEYAPPLPTLDRLLTNIL